jgi:hypothetical protein
LVQKLYALLTPKEEKKLAPLRPPQLIRLAPPLNMMWQLHKHVSCVILFKKYIMSTKLKDTLNEDQISEFLKYKDENCPKNIRGSKLLIF